MSKNKSVVAHILSNKIIQYIFSRYMTYVIQFVNSLFIALYLGPYYLGIWGFITLVIQYLSQLNFGIAHSANAIISVHKNKESYTQKVIGTSLGLLIILAALVCLFFAANIIFTIHLGEKFHFTEYSLVVAWIGILGYFNTLMSNVFRVFGKINEIAINQSSFPIVVAILLFFLRGKNLLWALVLANLLAFGISAVLYYYRSPIKIKPLFCYKLARKIQIRGWYLFLYNTSFYLIMISTRTLVSVYYDVKEFGYFTFGYLLGSVILLLLESFSFLIFPKLLNRFAYSTTQESVSLLNVIREAYITTSHLLVHLAILFFPLFIFLFPQYKNASDAFKLIALTLVLYSNSFGYTGLLIAKSQEKVLSKYSLLALTINISIALTLILVFKVRFESVIIATMASYALYVFFVNYLGKRILKLKNNVLIILQETFNLKLFIPFICSLICILSAARNIFFIVPPLLFVILNYKEHVQTLRLFIKILKKPELINI